MGNRQTSAHLTRLELEALSDQDNASRAAREHFLQCAACQQQAAEGQRLERALEQLARVAPAEDLAERIIAALPRQAQEPNANPWLGAATLIAAMLGFALAYQTAFTLRANGAFELVSDYTLQPEIVTTYPTQAWEALAAAVPWMTLAVSLVMLTIALVLTYRWTSRRGMRASG
ncbi:MAG: hypothetical protein IT331_20190 [Anaerolineae bacterium]|nr:hypothetical protein [Anaerolineae bacterium]